ncbi:MAG TPA: peptidoglycan binding domain-containing protein, partial [Armatimonadota bacterium]|nr:peptidoglycan binding domain-containing protein [Armatimonadota bacterium]
MSSPSSNTVLVSPPARGRMAGRIRVGLILGFSLFILLGMVVSAGALILPKDNLIADGVRIANLPVGGLTRAAAKQRLAEQWARADDRLVVHAGPHRRDLALRDLGIAPDVDATLDAALALGRQGPPLARLSDAWRLRQDGGEVHPVFTLDAARAEAAL